MNWNRIDQMDERILTCIQQLMHLESGALAHTILKSLQKLDASGTIDYYLGVYYLEYGKIYPGFHRAYIEGKVSFRRARRCLKRALRKGAIDSGIWVAMGDSYGQSRAFSKALPCYNRARELNPTNVRIVWCQMETNYMLGIYRALPELYAQFDWKGCTDVEFVLWGATLTAYAQLQMGQVEEARKIVRHLDEMECRTVEMATSDVFATCMLDLYYLIGEEQRMKRFYAAHEATLHHMGSICLEMLRSSTGGLARTAEIERSILTSFTPINLLFHLDW